MTIQTTDLLRIQTDHFIKGKQQLLYQNATTSSELTTGLQNQLNQKFGLVAIMFCK